MNQSKYQLIADEIRKKILSGDYSLGTAIPPELKLQKDYEVSRHTVRQAIAVLVNDGYLRKEKGSGTYVDDSYKRTVNVAVSSEHKTIGVITTYLSNYIFPSIIRGIENTLRHENYSLMLASTNNDHQAEKACLEKMIDYGVDGLIVEPTKSSVYNPNLALYVNLREQGIPIVMINAVYEELNAPSICVDDVKVGYLATECLIKNHHEKLLFISKIDDLQGKYRMKGFIKACEEYGIQFSPEDVITFTTETREKVIGEAMKRLISAGDSITGVVCYNDQIANLLAMALVEAGYKVPEDFSIVGNDDSSLSRVGSIKLTTLSHPKEQMGMDAAAWIVNTIEQGETQADILYQPKLVERDSVRKV
ncbi:GntR family transcriptional regulator [Listeria floridensis FSL S10-1187]|uniref:GntR family transcriptional regulator n=1 Tax=Listeria floridensis FSL S10-1187 TaxID=1265817 RepID=A0ABN0RC01_9LIST|nr:GntR family transcriptional regulator [Listeria floridensis]EUJ26143.1 GntR family transcriptional regulator [Listeria floridensis FSL S10-1187]